MKEAYKSRNEVFLEIMNRYMKGMEDVYFILFGKVQRGGIRSFRIGRKGLEAVSVVFNECKGYPPHYYTTFPQDVFLDRETAETVLRRRKNDTGRGD